MPLNRRSFLFGGLAASAGIAARQSVRSQSLEPVSIALDWYPNANHAGLFWAEEERWFEQVSLDVTLVTPADPTTVLQTVAAGRDTFGISYQPDILLARSQGLPVTAVCALVPRPLLGVMSLKSESISRPADLRGKVVGYTGIPSQEAFLQTMLAADGVGPDEITLNNVEFNLLPTLISGQAVAVMGAFWTHETIVAELEGYPVDMMRVEEWGVPLYNELVLVTNEERMANDPEIVESVINLIEDGYLAAAADQPRAIDLLVDAYPETERAVEEQGIALLADLWTQPDPGFGVLVPEAWAEFAAWMIDQDLLPADFSIAGAIGANMPVPATPTTTPEQ